MVYMRYNVAIFHGIVCSRLAKKKTFHSRPNTNKQVHSVDFFRESRKHFVTLLIPQLEFFQFFFLTFFSLARSICAYKIFVNKTRCKQIESLVRVIICLFCWNNATCQTGKHKMSQLAWFKRNLSAKPSTCISAATTCAVLAGIKWIRNRKMLALHNTNKYFHISCASAKKIQNTADNQGTWNCATFCKVVRVSCSCVAQLLK